MGTFSLYFFCDARTYVLLPLPIRYAVVDAAILRFRERLVDGVGRAMADVDGGRT